MKFDLDRYSQIEQGVIFEDKLFWIAVITPPMSHNAPLS